jgi:hypothetical protein
MTLNIFRQLICFLLPLSISTISKAQSWLLWASGLPPGTSPKMTVAPNHDIFYTLVGTPLAYAGLVYKANTTNASGSFTALPVLPFPPSHVNNINALGYNASSEPIVGIFRNTLSEPFLFRFNNSTNAWVAATVSNPPTLGAYCMVTAPNGNIFVGGRWANVYKSTDNGSTFSSIDESAILGAAYPCYYPSWGGVASDAAIYGINMDKNNRLYVGSESAGVVYSNDYGTTWHPADFFACQSANPTLKNGSSPMKPLSTSGNVAALGFTANNNLVWTRSSFWDDNWKNGLGYADMTAHTVTQTTGFSDYLITIGQQITKIVTTTNGRMFLHSGAPSGSPHADMGIFTSTDGIHWTSFNTGITGANGNQAQGSLAVDGNLVFMATNDGQVFRYDASLAMPLDLLSFSGKSTAQTNELTWQTANESNISHFILEKSSNAADKFVPIGDIKAKGNAITPPQYYRLFDAQPSTLNYYRLKIVENDGTYNYSKIIALKDESPSKAVISIYPNPANTVLNVVLNTTDYHAATLHLMDLTGRILLTQSKKEADNQPFIFPLEGFKSGIYMLVVTVDGTQTLHKVVIAQ